MGRFNVCEAFRGSLLLCLGFLGHAKSDVFAGIGLKTVIQKCVWDFQQVFASGVTDSAV